MLLSRIKNINANYNKLIDFFTSLKSEVKELIFIIFILNAISVLFFSAEYGEILYYWIHNDKFTLNAFMPFIAFFLLLRSIKNNDLFVKITVNSTSFLFCNVALLLFSFYFDIKLFSYIGIIALPVSIFLLFFFHSIKKDSYLPLLLFIFAAPVGSEITPLLQYITLYGSYALLSVIPGAETIDGMSIFVGLNEYIIEPDCAGFKFLSPMVIFGIVIAFYYTQKMKLRILILMMSVIIPIISNIIRVAILIEIGRYYGIEFMLGADHLTFGFVFFTIIQAIFLWAFWSHIDEFEYWPGNKKLADTIKNIEILQKSVEKNLMFLPFYFALLCLLIYQVKEYFYERI